MFDLGQQKPANMRCKFGDPGYRIQRGSLLPPLYHDRTPFGIDGSYHPLARKGRTKLN
jgi:hypothetical protein